MRELLRGAKKSKIYSGNFNTFKELRDKELTNKNMNNKKRMYIL